MNSIKPKEMDILNSGLAGKLILFAMPLAFSSILQQIFKTLLLSEDLREIMLWKQLHLPARITVQET